MNAVRRPLGAQLFPLCGGKRVLSPAQGVGPSSPPLQRRLRRRLRSTFASREQLEQVLEMGMEQGLREAVGQIDALL
jgi:hypothetical protein